MFSSTNSSLNGDLEKIRGDLGSLLQQQEEMKTQLADLSGIKDQVAELSNGQGALCSMLEDICEQWGVKRRPRRLSDSTRDAQRADQGGTGGRQETVHSGLTAVSGHSEGRSPKVTFTSDSDFGMREAGAKSTEIMKKSPSTSSIGTASRRASLDSVSDDDDQSASESDEDDESGTTSAMLERKKRTMVQMRQHESWLTSKTPNRRFVALGFDIFSSSTHTDFHDEATRRTMAKREVPRPAQLVVKEFRRFCGAVPHPRTWNPQRLVMSPSSSFTLFWTMLEGLLLMSDLILIR
jgi:hypothetical protein